MDYTAGQYIVWFQVQPFRKGRRYHWMICREQNPDELVSWGHALTQELAEVAARDEIQDLSAGTSNGGRVASTSYSGIHRC